MNTTFVSPTGSDASIGRLIQIADLEGWFAKWLVVPEGYRGIVMYPDGEVRDLSAGRLPVLSFRQRAAGRGIGARVALVSTLPFTRYLPVFGLRSGDGALLKANLVLSATIGDAARFMEQAPVTAGRLDAPSPDPFLVSEQLRALVRQFTTVDLLSGAAASALKRDLLPLLQPLFANTGLRLLDFIAISFLSADEQLKTAEQEHDVQEALKKLAHEAGLAELERQAEKKDFQRQLEGQPAGAGLPPTAGKPETEKGKPLPPPFSFDRRKKSEIRRELPPGYLRLQVLKISAMFIFMAILTVVVDPLLIWLNLRNSIQVPGLLTSLWTTAVVIFGKTVWDIYEKVTKEEKQSQFIDYAPESELDDIAFSRHTSVDEFLRTQANRELAHILENLNHTWKNLSQRDQTRVAWALKQLVHSVEQLKERVLDPVFGQPSYPTNHGNLHELQTRQIEYDQAFLLFLESVTTQSDQLRLKSVNEIVSQADADDLIRQVIRVETSFEARRRPPKIG